MSRVGQSARVDPIAEGLEDRVRDRDSAERDVSGVHAFGEGDEVRGDVPVVEGEPATGAAESGHHLVGDEDDPVLRRQLAHAGEVAGRWGVDPRGARHGLEDEGRDIAGPLEGDHVLEVSERPLRLLGLGRRVEVRPVGVGRHEVDDALSGVVVGEPARVAGDVDGQLRAAVVAAVGREHLRPTGVQSGHPDRVLVRVGPTVREEHMVEVARGAFGDESGRLGAGVVDVLRRDRAQLACLLLDGRNDGRVLMADIRVDQLRRHVEQLSALAVPDVGAGGVDDRHRSERPLSLPGVEDVRTVEFVGTSPGLDLLRIDPISARAISVEVRIGERGIRGGGHVRAPSPRWFVVA